MRFLSNLPWIGLGGLMILHGIAHSPAVLGSWKLASFEDVSFQPNVLFTSASDPLVYALGAVWFLAALSFIVAGIGVLRQAFWWPVVTAFALVLSVSMTLLWQQDAAIGLVLNGFLLVVLTAMYLLGQLEERQFA
jgi:hypothetical protein